MFAKPKSIVNSQNTPHDSLQCGPEVEENKDSERQVEEKTDSSEMEVKRNSVSETLETQNRWTSRAAVANKIGSTEHRETQTMSSEHNNLSEKLSALEQENSSLRLQVETLTTTSHAVSRLELDNQRLLCDSTQLSRKTKNWQQELVSRHIQYQLYLNLVRTRKMQLPFLS